MVFYKGRPEIMVFYIGDGSTHAHGIRRRAQALPPRRGRRAWLRRHRHRAALELRYPRLDARDLVVFRVCDQNELNTGVLYRAPYNGVLSRAP